MEKIRLKVNWTFRKRELLKLYKQVEVTIRRKNEYY